MDDFFRCSCPNPVCGKRLKALPDQAGRGTRCPSCNELIVPRPAPPRRRAAPPAERPRWAWVAGGTLALLLMVGLGVWSLTHPHDRATAERTTEPAAVTTPQ